MAKAATRKPGEERPRDRLKREAVERAQQYDADKGGKKGWW